MATGQDEENEEQTEGKKIKFSIGEEINKLTNFKVGNSFDEKSRNVIIEFIADSGATEHLSKTKLIFETLNEKDNCEIKCANKEVALNTEGLGEVRIKSGKGKEFILSNVLYSKELSEN